MTIIELEDDEWNDIDKIRGPESNHRVWLRPVRSFGSESAAHILMNSWGSGQLKFRDCTRSVEFELMCYDQKSLNETARFFTKLRSCIDKAEEAVVQHAVARNLDCSRFETKGK